MCLFNRKWAGGTAVVLKDQHTPSEPWFFVEVASEIWVLGSDEAFPIPGFPDPRFPSDLPGFPRISPAFLGYPIPGYIMLSEVPQATHSKKPPMEYGSEPSGFRTYSIGGLWMHTRIHRICCAITLRSQQQLRYAMPLASITVRGRRTMQCLRDASQSCPNTSPQPRSA